MGAAAYPAGDEMVAALPLSPRSTSGKFLCSYGGRIQPRPHDGRLVYAGGHTKILGVDRGIRFPSLLSKISTVSGFAAFACLKYQLPGEDLDALVSVLNDEDLEHMMLEHDRVQRSNRSPRIRLFLFSLFPPPPPPSDPQSAAQWFIDALNSVPIRPTMEPANPDYLLGLNTIAKDKDPEPEPEPDPEPEKAISPAAEAQATFERGIEELHGLKIEDKALSRVSTAEPNLPRIPEASLLNHALVNGGERPVHLVAAMPVACSSSCAAYYVAAVLAGEVARNGVVPAWVAYDSAGRAVYYTQVVPTYRPVQVGPSSISVVRTTPSHSS